MRILYYTDVFPPIIVNYATNLVGGLVADVAGKALDVTVVTRTPSGDFDDASLPYRVIRRPNALRLWQLLHESDLIHLAGPCLLPLFLAWITRKPTVVEHHGYQAACPNGLLLHHPTRTPCPGHFQLGHYNQCFRCNIRPEGSRRSTAWLLLTFPRYWLSHRVNANICITRHVQDRLQLPRSRVIYYGIRDANPRESPDIGNVRPPCFAYAGRLVSEKGLDLFLEAAQRLHADGCEFSLRFIGDGPERPHLRKMVESLALTTRVVFTGSLQGDALRLALNDVAVMVMPSVWEETAGLSAIEQMMRGRMVIAADIGGLGEVVGGAGLKFPPGDVEGLAACMRIVLQQPGLVPRLGAKARKRARQLFLRDRMVAEHVALYREVVKHPDPRFKNLSSANGFRLSERVFWQALFVLWIILVNFLYYAQYKALIVSRLGHFLSRWH